MSLKAVRAALAAQIATHVNGLTVFAYEPGSVVAPAAVIRFEPFTYYTTLPGQQGQSTDPTLIVLLLSELGDADAQDFVDDLIDPTNPTGIPEAIDADTTLGGTVEYATVESLRNYGIVEYGGVQYQAASLAVSTGLH